MSSRIAPAAISTAPEETRASFATIKKALGAVPNLFATMGQSPAALRGYLAFTDALARGVLSSRDIELVNLHVSELNGCGYCLSAHTSLGARVGLSPDEMTAARAGHGSTARDAAILSLARRIVRTGGGGAGTELAFAREVGLTDAEIVEVIAHVASKAFTNALAIVAQTEIDFPKAPRLPQP
jgi:uncharacterized peroxidase-related enzyme